MNVNEEGESDETMNPTDIFVQKSFLGVLMLGLNTLLELPDNILKPTEKVHCCLRE